MADADERTELDRREKGDEATEDAREEYTSYRERGEDRAGTPDRTGGGGRGQGETRRRVEGEDEAEREADLQPDSRDEP